MNKEGNLQFEFFTRPDNPSPAAGREKNSSHFKRLRNYERMILVIIGTVATAIISFSLGVEKGKNLSLLQNNPRFDTAAQTRQQAFTPAPLQKATAIKPQMNSDAFLGKQETDKAAPEKVRGFTIQLASYKTKSYAEKEAKDLKKKGLMPLILTKGSYVVLCVGSFANKENALSLLTQFEKRYNGCRVRRL